MIKDIIVFSYHEINRYRISFWPPDDSDNIETHDQFDLDRGAITNVADAVKII